MSAAGPPQGANAPSEGSAVHAVTSVGALKATGARLMAAHDLANERERMYLRRKRVNKIALGLSLAAMVFGVFWLVWILWETVALGIGGMTWATVSQMTPPPNETGGIANALWGSLLMVMLATFVGTPIGIMAGIYLAEYGARGALGAVTRFVNDILLSAPSIVIGLFVYAVVVARYKHFSGWAGAIALALIVIPVVIRTTENMLLLVPAGLREAAYALGAPKWKVITAVTLRAARAGVVTGVLLAVARISGETAPLLFTSLNNQFFTSNLSDPIASLPVTIFKFAMSPYENWQQLAWAGVFLITLAVLGLNIFARVLTRAKV
jgi:phosphate transport system permease protein